VEVYEAHGPGKPPEQLNVRDAFAGRLNGRLVKHQVEVAPRHHQVILLGLHGRRKEQVRVLGRVGDEQLAHDREQVLALESRYDLAGIGRLRNRIGVVDEKRLYRRVERHVADEGSAEIQFVDDNASPQGSSRAGR
jgi:hypothetical protein